MTNLLFKKVIAKEGERELIDCSEEEMSKFISGTFRQDFENDDVICIKFFISDNADFKDAEETCWYINPEFYEKLSLEQEGANRKLGVFEEDKYPEYLFQTPETNLIKMPSNLLPELILMFVNDEQESIFEQYIMFEGELMMENLLDAPDSVKLERFLQSLNN